MINSCLITFLTGGILLFAIKKLTGRLHAILAPVWWLSILFVIKLASSQYSDLLVGLYFLTACVAFLYFQRTHGRAWLIIMALACGLMSFTKSEGLALAMITIFTTIFWRALLITEKNNQRADLLVFAGAATIALIPAIVFKLLYPIDSHTFINGLTSLTKPTDLERLQAIFVFLGMELISIKWAWFWWLALSGIILAGRRAWRRDLAFMPIVLAGYLTVVIGVYWVNTFFEILWWMSTTLHRLLLAVTPVIILWIFLALERTPLSLRHQTKS